MNDLMVKVENINGVLVTTSNRVAEELGVRHDHLTEKIDSYIVKFSSPELSGQFYILSNYKALNGRTVKNYLITKKGIAQLIGGYSSAVEKAFDLNVAYINRFEEMEEVLKGKFIVPTSFKEALLLAAKQQEEIERLQLEDKMKSEKIIELQPKADYCDNILKPNHVFAIKCIAKDLGITSNEMNKILESLKVQYRGHKLMPWVLRAEYDWLVPQYCDYEDFKSDYMKTAVKNLKWSEKGRMWLIETLDQAGYLEWFDGKPRVKNEKKRKIGEQLAI